MINEGFSKYRRVYGLLFRTYGKSWHIRLAFLMAILARISKFVALPIATSQIIAAISVQDFGRAKNMVLVFALFSAILGILTPLVKYIALLGENKVYDKLTASYFSCLIGADIKYFNDNLTGYLTAATRQYCDSSLDLIRKIRDRYIGTVLSIILPVIVISFVSRLLGLVVFGLSIVQAVYLLWASQKIAPFRTRSREKYKEVSGYIADAISNAVTVKSTAQEQPVSGKVKRLVKQETALFIEKYKAQAKMVAARELITVMSLLSLFWITVSQNASGKIGIGGAVLVITYSFTILTGVYELSDSLEEHDDYIDKIIPGFEVLDRQNKVNDKPNPIKLDNVRGQISCQNITFAYQEASGLTDVFKDFNLQIPAGQKIGIVGLSGAGKSTLTRLLLRFEDVSMGKVCIDGINIKDVAQADLRKHIAYVPQEPLLFHTSIQENIRFSRPGATDEEVAAAAKAAHALEFIESLPNGFNSVVGERGVKLSGGQKQRVVIARAVLQDTKVIILDEATSALDSESEQIVKSSFAQILKNKTAIVVAHRLSTLSDMDRIVVIENGKIAEDGTHSELLQKQGLYARLWTRQQSFTGHPHPNSPTLFVKG